MLIGVVTDRNDDRACVAPTLEEGVYLIVVDSEAMAVRAMHKNNSHGAGFITVLLDWNCEAVVCGTIQKEAFEPIAAASITRYNGVGLPIGDAVVQAHENRLPLITDFEGGTGCADHDHSTCDCGV